MVLWTPSVRMNYTKGLINSMHRITEAARIGKLYACILLLDERQSNYNL